MYRKTFTLTQHTPLIHFQYDQAGATLRATEVKPKLDRFINEQLKKVAKAKNEDYLTQRFLYRILIKQTGTPEKILIVAGSLSQEQKEALNNAGIRFIDRSAFFALEKEVSEQLFEPTGETRLKRDRNGEPKRDRNGELVYVDLLRVVDDYNAKISKWGMLLPQNGKIDVTVMTSEQTALQLVSKYISAFFICTNFGTRSTKGFGSFSVDGKTDAQGIQNALASHYDYRYRYTVTSEKRNQLAKLKEYFDWMQSDYRRLKSGRSFGGYRKAQTFLYGVRQNAPSHYRWDKRYLKGNIVAAKNDRTNGFRASLAAKKPRRELTDENGNNNGFVQNANYKFVRALLGLTENFEFQTRGGGDKYKVKVKGGDVERYASPIIWKVINDKIYLVANEPNAELRDAAFNFSLKLGNGREEVDFGPLHPPTQQEFMLGEFLAFAFNENRPYANDYEQPIYDYENF